MPYGRDSMDEDHDDDANDGRGLGSKRKFSEFECPECAAYNPHDDGFGDGDEVLCNYCGESFKARVNDEGKLRLRAA